MKIKKILLGVLALSIMLTAVSCKKETGTGVGDTMRISLLFSESGTAPYKSDWLVLKEIEKRQNVKLNLQVVPDSDYQTKRSIVFASGEIPDLISNTWPNEVSQYAADGLMLPVSDYLDKLPNLKSVIEDWNLGEDIENISELDGKFYVLPGFTKDYTANLVWGVREDKLKELNLTEPASYDELAAVLKKFKEAYPDSLGFGDPFNGSEMMSFAAPSFNTNGGWSLPNCYSYHWDTNEWYFAPTSEEYKTMLTYFNNLYKDGLLDAEAFTQDGNQFQQKILNDKYFIMPVQGYTEAKSHTGKLVNLGKTDAKVVPLLPLKGPDGIAKTKPGARSTGGIGVAASASKRKDFDRFLSFCDWLYYSDEAVLLTKAGVEGVSYNYDGGKFEYAGDVKTVFNKAGTVDMWTDYAVGMMGFTTLVGDKLPIEVVLAGQDPVSYEFTQELIQGGYGLKDDPILKLTPAQLEKTKLLITTLKDYTGSMMLKYIYGQESFDNWDKYIKECKAKGSDELMEIVRSSWKK
jgi:putative aldouronate transport system substrate-binding protein